jgi:hypothetical protein
LLQRSLWRAPELNDQLSTEPHPMPNSISGNRAVAGVWLMFAAACGLVATLLACRVTTVARILRMAQPASASNRTN